MTDRGIGDRVGQYRAVSSRRHSRVKVVVVSYLSREERQ